MATVHGTQAVAVVTAEGVVLAADSRHNLSNGARQDGHRKVVTLPAVPNLGFVTAGTSKWLPEGVTVYTGTEQAEIDVKGLVADYATASRPASVDEAFLAGLGGHVSSALAAYFAARPRRWGEWASWRDDGVLQPGWCKIMVAHQSGCSAVATVRVMRGDTLPAVTYDFKLDRVDYQPGAVAFTTNGYLGQEAARPVLAGLFRAVPGIGTKSLTAASAAGVARAFIEQVALVSPTVGGRIDAVLISDSDTPRDL